MTDPESDNAATRLAAGALILAVLFAGLLALFPDSDPDLWWHLKTGEIILERHAVPRTDPFTYTAAGRPWVTHEWLSEVMFAVLYRIGGMDLLTLFKALLAAAALGLGAAAALAGPRWRERLAPAALGAVLAAPLLAARAYVRPHLLTAVFIGLTLLLLQRERLSGRRIFRVALGITFLLWANLHSGFVLGLGLVALYWFGDFLDRRRRGVPRDGYASGRSRIRVLGVLALITLVNPNHVQALLYPVRLMARPEVRRSIGELHNLFHPVYRGALFLYVLLAVALLAAVFLVVHLRTPGRAHPAWSVLLPALALGALSIGAVRNLNEFAILVPLLFAAHGEWIGRRPHRAAAASVAVILLAAAGSAIAAGPGIPMGQAPPRKLALRSSQHVAVESAAQFLESTGSQGRLFNTLGFGGYLIFRLWPQWQVFIDGRLDVFPHGFLDEYGRLMSRGDGWDQACHKYGITMAVVDYRPTGPGDAGVRARLRSAPDWTCVFFSENAIVYARRVPENETTLARFACPFDPSLRTMESIWNFAKTAPAPSTDKAIAAMSAMAELAPTDRFLLVNLGQMLDACGRSAEAAVPLRAVLRRDPGSLDTRLLLASALVRAGAYAEARTELDPLVKAGPRRTEAQRILVDLEQRERGRNGARDGAGSPPAGR